MSKNKKYLDKNVYEATLERIEFILSEFDNFYVSCSGGKDSTVLLYLVMEVARRMKRTPIKTVFIDWEAQYQTTISHIEKLLLHPDVLPFWICLPLTTDNSSSFFEPLWTCWDKDKKDVWVREMPKHDFIVKEYDRFSFYKFGMTFEEFVPQLGQWMGNDEKVASLIGLRASESLNRFRAVKKKKKKPYKNIAWSTNVAEECYNFYPMYDWQVEDVWAYIGKNNLPYNHAYDLMYMNGASVHDMRICEPYGLEARKGIQHYHIIEPETWFKMVKRVDGLNTGSIYGIETLFAWQKMELPAGHTWKSYTQYLLNSLPEPIRDHYLRRINIFVEWFRKNEGWNDLKDEDDPKLEAKRLGGSWRMVARAILKNDFFCHGLSFAVNKNEYGKFMELTKHHGHVQDTAN